MSCVCVYRGNLLVVVALVSKIWAWQLGNEGVRAVPKLFWVRAEPTGEWDEVGGLPCAPGFWLM